VLADLMRKRRGLGDGARSTSATWFCFGGMVLPLGYSFKTGAKLDGGCDRAVTDMPLVDEGSLGGAQ